MMAGDQSSYILDRDADETKLLNEQHRIVLANIGYDLHPALIQRLPKTNVQIADVATGSTIFLLDLSRKLPKETALHGFDISNEQFPQAADLPDNVHLHTHDARKPFNEAYHNKFDIVHIRYLTLGLQPADWPNVARNVFSLVKPGGAVQWMEFDMAKSWLQPYRNTVPNPSDPIIGYESLRHAGKIYVDLYGERLVGWSVLEQALKEAGFTDVVQECVSLDRLPESRGPMSLISINRWASGMKAAVSQGREIVPGMGPATMEWVESTEKAMLEDVRRGSYIREDQYIFIAFKQV